MSAFEHDVGKQVVGDGELCGVCETVVQYLDSLLEENATVAQIEQWLDKICNFVPGGLKEQVIIVVMSHHSNSI